MEGYLTIRQAAAKGIMPEYRLRVWQKEGKLPGIYAGSRFYVNTVALKQLLDEETYKNTIKKDC